MKDGFKDIVGRQVAAVIVASNEKGHPRHQVFLVFTDGASFELWGDSFTCCSGVDRKRDIERYVKSGGGQVVAVYTDAAQRGKEPMSTTPSPASHYVNESLTLEALMTRDLAAWSLAKHAIERAKSR